MIARAEEIEAYKEEGAKFMQHLVAQAKEQRNVTGFGADA